MAKIDFCFTYYDGDATRDMAHMNRLERGAYSDLIISQRKFGRLSISQIQKILGKDFNDCWPAIELVMKSEDEKYFIEWLEDSVIKGKKHAKHQSDNGSKGGRGNKSEIKPNESELKPNDEKIKPLEDGDGIKESKEVAQTVHVVPQMLTIWKKTFPDYFEDREKDSEPLRKIALHVCKVIKEPEEMLFTDPKIKENVMRRWGEISKFIGKESFFKNYSLTQVERHFQSILSKEKDKVEVKESNSGYVPLKPAHLAK